MNNNNMLLKYNPHMYCFDDVKLKIMEIFEYVKNGDTELTINEIIELNNAKLYLCDQQYFNKLECDYTSDFDKIKKCICIELDKNIKKLNSNRLMAEFDDIAFDFKNKNLLLLISSNIKQLGDITEFFEAKILKNVNLGEILKNKVVVKHFSELITSYMLATPKSAEKIIDAEISNGEVYLPCSLDDSIKTKILKNYVDSDIANPNYLEKIAYLNKTLKKDFESNLIKLTAIKKVKSITDNIFKEKDKTYKHSLEIKIDYQKEITEFNEKDNILSFSIQWLYNSLDFPSILNNFIYVFEFVDTDFRINGLNNIKDSVILNNYFGIYDDGLYVNNGDIIFELKENLFISIT